ncbi:MAG: hypothetical protein ACRDYZ_01245, partial [Acidimicrobiales bacterium]
MPVIRPTGPAPVPPVLDRSRVPVHVAWVASGTGRWAHQRGATPDDVAAAVEAAVDELVDGALDLGVGWLTVFAPLG